MRDAVRLIRLSRQRGEREAAARVTGCGGQVAAQKVRVRRGELEGERGAGAALGANSRASTLRSVGSGARDDRDRGLVRVGASRTRRSATGVLGGALEERRDRVRGVRRR